VLDAAANAAELSAAAQEHQISSQPDPLHAWAVEAAAVAKGVGVPALALHNVGQDVHAAVRVPADRKLILAPAAPVSAARRPLRASE
jgi:hypothetical protein